MAKYIDYKKQQLELFQRTENYAKHVRDIYRNAFTDIIDLVKGTELEKGKPFSFSDYGYSEEVTPILRKMYSQVYQEIRGGVEKEWLNSNDHNDELVKSVFGEKAIKTGHFAKYFARNMEAMNAFFARKSQHGGLNLSQYVWNYTGQYKEELENALDLAIGEGTPANRVAAQVKGYLEDPDRFYRRFAYKVGEDEDGNPVYGRKWKRRIWDEIAQSYKWIDANPKHYHPGKGIYRSSARNAQRLARTEINMAYRAADHDRWGQLDFVVGIEVNTSNNHNCKGVPKGTFVDICDDLKGKYPKDFKFVGWHPMCRCYAVPILAPQENIEDMLAKMIDGEEDVPVVAPNRVDKLPDNFQEWKDKNEDRIAKAKARGTLPYFIRDNEDLIWKKKLTPQEIGQARHDGRTKIEIFEIKKRWNDRRATYQYGNNVMRIMGGISDVDTAALEAAIKSGDQAKILAESRKLKKIGKQIYALDLLDDPMAVAKKFSMADAQAVQKAVKSKLDLIKTGSLETQKNTLNFEIDWVKDHKKYATWEVAAKAYEKALEKVKVELQREKTIERTKNILEFLKNNPKNKKVKNIYSFIKISIDQGDFNTAKAFTDKAYEEIEAFTKKKNKDLLKKISGSTPKDLDEYIKQHYTTDFTVTSQESYENVMQTLGKDTKAAWNAATVEQKKAFPAYTNDGSVSHRVLSNVGQGKPDPLAKNLDAVLDNIETSQDLVLRSGQNYDVAEYVFGKGFAQMLSRGDIAGLNNTYTGQVGINRAYMSTSFNKNGGFGKQFEVHIFAPKGTHLINMNEISYFGRNQGISWDGESFYPIWSSRGETEIFLHRGYKWRFVKAEAGVGLGGTNRIYVQLLDRVK